MKAFFKSVLMLALVSVTGSQAMAREFQATEFALALTYSNVAMDVFDASVVTLKGKIIWSDDQAYCQMKLEKLAPVPCVFARTTDYYTQTLPVVTVTDFVSAAKTKPGSAHLARALDIFVMGMENKKFSGVGIGRSFDGYISQPIQLHDPKSATEAVHIEQLEAKTYKLKSKQ